MKGEDEGKEVKFEIKMSILTFAFFEPETV